MQFLIGIQHMTRDEKILLLSQLNAITTRNVLNQGVQTMAKKAKNFTLKQSSTLARYVNAHTLEEKIEQLDQISEWDAEVLARKIEEEIEKNSFLKDRELNVHIKWKIAELAGADKNEEDTKIAAELVNRLAVLYDINPALYPTSTALEEEVYAACIEEQIKILKKKLQSMSAEEEKTLEEALREELGRLSRAEQEAIKELSGLEELSAQSILNLLKTTSSVALAQIVIGSTGFGAYLFLTTVMKAFSLLLGVTFSFGAYTAATAGLAFLLSAPFLLLVFGASGGFIWYKTSRNLADQGAKIAFLAGRTQLGPKGTEQDTAL